MKTFNFLIILLSLTSLMSCKKKDNKEGGNITVEKYVELLKSNRYNYSDLPEFTYLDIPALLKYRNETQFIIDFPHNSISSFYGEDCKLGIYVLWTIESIRGVAINSEYLIMRFPSQNPILALRDSNELISVNIIELHEVAAKAYFDWWENNKLKNFNEFKNIDPLQNKGYKWR